MHGAEGDAGVISLEHDSRPDGVQPESEAVAAAFGGDVAAGSPRGGECGVIEHGAVAQALPQPMHVGHRRIRTAVAAAAHREVEDVTAVTLDVEIAERGAFR